MDNLYEIARAMLMSGPSATPPRHRAIKKMVKYLRANPLHQYTKRHQRGSWRSWPTKMEAAVG